VSEGERGLLGVGFTPARVIATISADAVASAVPEVAPADESDLCAEARELVSPTEAHANLEWIIGARRNLAWDGVAFDRDMAQLALLWLQDLARELDGEASPALAPVLDEAGEWTADPRRAAARRLRMATRDFAEVIADDRAEGTGRR